LVIPIAVWKNWMIIFFIGILGPSTFTIKIKNFVSFGKLPRDLTPKIFLLHLREYIYISFIAINRVTNTRIGLFKLNILFYCYTQTHV
jgi:hypothetical protein